MIPGIGLSGNVIVEMEKKITKEKNKRKLFTGREGCDGS